MALRDDFIIGDWQVFPREGKIASTLDGSTQRVRLKAMDVLCELADRQGQLVERDDLLASVWGRQAVSDEPLTSTIGELRRLLREPQGQQRRYIETLPKRGYRLVATVSAVPPVPVEPETVTRSAAVNDARAAEAVESVERLTRNSAGAVRRAPRVRLDWTALVALALVVALAAFAVHRFSGDIGPLPVPSNSIAVLPFDQFGQDTSEAKHSEFGAITNGFSEDLMSLLSSVSGLRVAARQSSLAAAKTGQSPGAMGATLKVAHLLTGQVRQTAKGVSVRVQLIATDTGYQRWAASFERRPDEIFAVQDEIVAAVRAELGLRDGAQSAQARPTDLRAYSLYQQGRHVGRQHTADSFRHAARLFNEALAIDPNYAPAWNDLAGVYLNQIGFALLPREEGFRLASEAAYKALAIDESYAAAHGRLGWIALHAGGDLPAAARHYRRALALEPGNEIIRSGAAPIALALGRLELALELFEGSAIDDPVSPASHANLANAYLLSGRYVEAEQSIRNALTLSPSYAGAQYRLGRALLAQGKLDDASEAMNAEQIDAARWIGQALIANARGDEATSDALLGDVLEAHGDAAAGNLAQVYAHRGDMDRAFHWLNRELEVSGVAPFVDFRWDPVFAQIRSDPRWHALMQRLELDPISTASVRFP
ncbi:MAG: tetratricopeptide repeat protein [Pseudomonadaceae bacterium]|nr:tetratricopeptide repeat protein [Pseudomonadaceae bacterium]